jgi:CspA family cold shock protein
MGREHGEVKWFNGKKGYGFIVRDNGEEIFVHYREIQGQGRRVLFEGQKVEFRVGEGQKGPEAQEVTPL